MEKPPQIAVLGGGTFVRTQYIPRLAEISNLFVLKAIWSRSQESANSTVELARKVFPYVECKWGEEGLEEIINDSSITGVAVVLAGQFQVEMSLRLLKAGKHVLQETLGVGFAEISNEIRKRKKFGRVEINQNLKEDIGTKIQEMIKKGNSTNI